jgi:hypothetical protein
MTIFSSIVFENNNRSVRSRVHDYWDMVAVMGVREL